MEPSAGDGWTEIPGWPDRLVSERAAHQQTMIASAQLRALGISTSAITRAVDRGRLHRVHHGVYSQVMPTARPRLAAEHAAILACGSTAVLSHHTAAALLGLTQGRSAPVHVTVTGTRRHHPGLVVHHTAALDRAERLRVAGLPVTSVVRTVIDLAAGQSDGFVEQLVDQALKKTSRAKLTEVLDRHSGRPGTAAVRRAVDPGRPSGDTWSRAERRLLALVRRAGLPTPEANVPVGRYFPDLLWREHQVIVEYDSREFHSSEGARTADAARHNDLTSWGYRVLHVTRDRLSAHTEEVLVWITAALTHNGWSPAA